MFPAVVFNLAAPDLVILAAILLMLGAPIATVVIILRLANRSRSAPPLPPEPKPPSGPEPLE